MIQPGVPLPRFELTDLQGRVHRSLPLKSPTLLVFFKAGCATCELSLPLFGRLALRFPGLELLGVCQEAPGAAAELAGRLGLSFPVAPDPEPHPVSRSCALDFVPSWVAVSGGEIVSAGEGWSRAGFEELARTLAGGLGQELSGPVLEDAGIPAWRPG